MKTIIAITIIFFLFISCKRDKSKNAILMAEREAPIGWNYLRIYKDSTFEFEYRSFRNSKSHEGTVRLINDTLYFNYFDSVPAFGNKAVIKRNNLIYMNGNYNERLEVWLDSITK